MERDLLALDEQICFPLYAATRAIARRYTELLAPSGLTYPQYLALIALWDAPGPLSVGELGDRLRLDSGTLTPLLKRLEAVGLVSRRRDAQDERRVLVEPTRAGVALRPRIAHVPRQVVADLGLDDAGRDELRARLDGLIVRLDAAIGQPPTVL